MPKKKTKIKATINLILEPKAYEQLRDLQAFLGTENLTETVMQSVKFVNWMVEEKLKGNKILIEKGGFFGKTKWYMLRKNG